MDHEYMAELFLELTVFKHLWIYILKTIFMDIAITESEYMSSCRMCYSSAVLLSSLSFQQNVL